MRKVYIIIEHCRGRKETTHLIFSTLKKAQKYCDKENSRPEPYMGWGRSYSFKEIVLNEV